MKKMEKYVNFFQKMMKNVVYNSDNDNALHVCVVCQSDVLKSRCAYDPESI